MPVLPLKKAKYAILMAEFGGFRYLFQEISQRIYRKEQFIGLEKHLSLPIVQIESKIPYSLSIASAEDMEDIFRKIKTESKSSIFELIQRKWFYETGFHTCYIARAAGNLDICYMQWMISRKDANAWSDNFKSSFFRLRDEDIQLEHAYTFEKYRGNRIMPSVMTRLFEIARDKGFKRVITYVIADNIGSLKGCYLAGFKKFEEIHRTKFPFSTQYEINEST
jgi:hypothetical protein